MRGAWIQRLALGLRGGGLALLTVTAVWAGPLEYALPPPALNLADLHLPAVPSPDAATMPEDGTTARALRDLAIRAFYEQQYGRVLELFDRMPPTTEPSPSVQQMHAWSATLAGQDQQAEALWAQLSSLAPTEVRPLELAAWHALRQNRTEEATARYTQAVRLEPANARLRHMAGLSTWAAGRTITAQRLLVEALRNPAPLAESVLAMAALQVELEHYPEALGWLRRAMPLVPEEARAAWLTRSEFKQLAAQTPAAWKVFLSEFDLPETPAVDRPARDPNAAPPVTQVLPAPPEEMFLRLSPFTRDPRLRMEQVRAYQMDFALRRLRVTEHLDEESALGTYETITHAQ